MADEQNIEIEVHDERVIAQLHEFEMRARRRLRGIIDEGAEHTATWLRIYVPKWTNYTLRHIDQTGAVWNPGGAGGGGEWKAIAGVKRGVSKHPIYMLMGTGIYVGRGLITPKGWPRPDAFDTESGDEWDSFWEKIPERLSKRKLHFRNRSGTWVTTPFVRGQKPKTFLYQTFQQTRLYALARVHTFGAEVGL